jgi:hypothetical protein
MAIFSPLEQQVLTVYIICVIAYLCYYLLKVTSVVPDIGNIIKGKLKKYIIKNKE